MRNETELKKLFPKFKKHLNERLSLAASSTLEFEFLSWWCETNYEGYVSLDYTDAKGDGKIDAVVKRPNGEIIVIQAKYNDGYAKVVADVDTCPNTNWEPFDMMTIPAFKNQTKFEQYMKTQKVPRDKRQIYQKVFDTCHTDPKKVKFELVTTYDRPRNIENRLTNLSPLNFQGINSVFSLFQLQENYQSPGAAPLELTIDENNILSKTDTKHGIVSVLAEVKLREIIEYMQAYSPDYYIISKNVRTYLKSGENSINENIRLTYEDKPEEFFYSHNGITILCEEIQKTATTTSKTKFTLDKPNVINGGQTIMSLREVIPRKINNEGTVLVKIFEIEHNAASDKLINEIIYRTNQQNPIYWYNLRANEESQYILAKHCMRRDVYYERRQNEAKLNKSKIKAGKLITIGIQEAAQILKICQDGSDGVVFAVQKKKKLFEIETIFNDVFDIEPDTAFFQIMLFRLIDSLCSELKKGGDMKYVKRTIFSIIYSTLKDNSYVSLRTFDNYVSQVNADRFIFNNKANKAKFTDLRNVCDWLFRICEQEQKELFRKDPTRKIAATLKIFISDADINKKVERRAEKMTSITTSKRKNIKNEIVGAFTTIFP